MRRIEVTVEGKRYIWSPKPRNIAFICATLLILIAGITNIGTLLVSAGTSAPNQMVLDVPTKELDVIGFNTLGEVTVSSVNIGELNGSRAVTEYGELPLLAVNFDGVEEGEIVYLELGDTTDSTKSTVYCCIDGSDYLEEDSVGLINDILTGTSYSGIKLYEVLAK